PGYHEARGWHVHREENLAFGRFLDAALARAQMRREHVLQRIGGDLILRDQALRAAVLIGDDDGRAARGTFGVQRFEDVEFHNGLAANSVCSLPPCGGGLGRGVMSKATAAPHSSPPPPTPPHKGEGSGETGRSINPPSRQTRGWSRRTTARPSTRSRPRPRPRASSACRSRSHPSPRWRPHPRPSPPTPRAR